MTLDFISLPDITDDKLENKKERRQIKEYLYQLTEQLRYTLSNLDEENFIEGALEESIAKSSAVKEYQLKLEDAEGSISSVKQTTKSLSASVASAEGDISSLELTTSGLKASIDNNKLVFNSSGLNVYNGGFAIYNSGNNKVFGVDTGGNISMVGELKTNYSTSGYGVSIWQSSIGFYKDNGSTWSGQIDVDANYGMRLYAQGSIALFTENNSGWVEVLGNLRIKDWGENAQSRIVMASPATASGGTEARWVERTDLGGWSLGRLTSSRRYKENIEYIEDRRGMEICRKLKPAEFTYKDGGDTQVGMIAEDVAEVYTPAVNFSGGQPDGLMYSNMVALAISAVKDVDARLKKLEERENDGA